MDGCRYKYGDRKCHHPNVPKEEGYVDWCVESPCHLEEPETEEQLIAKEPAFEYNCLQIDGETSGGCPVCPICKEPTYSLEWCAFCGQRFKVLKEN